MTRVRIFPVVLFGAGVLVAFVTLPILLIDPEGWWDEGIWLLGAGGLAVAALGMAWRAGSKHSMIDFSRRVIVRGSDTRPFSKLRCIILTEGLQVIRSESGTSKSPTFHAVLGFGEVSPERMERALASIEMEKLPEDFIAAHSNFDEFLAGKLLRETELHALELIEANAYFPLWKCLYRLAREAQVAFVELTGGHFSVIRGDDFRSSLPERLAASSKSITPALAADAGVTVEERHDGVELRWRYSLIFWIIFACLMGSGMCGLGFFLMSEELDIAAWIFAGIFGALGLIPVVWLFSLHGVHRLRVQQNLLTYHMPLGRSKRLALDKLYKIHIRPNASGGISKILLLNDGGPIVVHGKLASLRGLKSALHLHFAARG